MGLLVLGRSGAQRRLLARFGRNGVRGQGTSRDLCPFLSSGWHQSGFAAILQPVTFTPNVDGRRVMQQPVQNRRGDDRITEDRSPVPVTLVRGQDDAPAFVPRAHQLKEYRRSQIVQRQIPDFVDHQNFRCQVHAHPAISRPSRYARPKSAARSCAVMKYAPNPERIASSASATLKCVFPTPGGPSKITLLASWINRNERNSRICRSSSEG